MSVCDIDFGLELRKANEEGYIEGYDTGITKVLKDASDEQFKLEARRRGYNLIKTHEKVKTVKLSPCVCGRKQIACFVTVMPGQSMNFEFYKCEKCGLTANLSQTNQQARLNWNAMIEEKMKDARK